MNKIINLKKIIQFIKWYMIQLLINKYMVKIKCIKILWDILKINFVLVVNNS